MQTFECEENSGNLKQESMVAADNNLLVSNGVSL